jgi:hypothetical protein
VFRKDIDVLIRLLNLLTRQQQQKLSRVLVLQLLHLIAYFQLTDYVRLQLRDYDKFRLAGLLSKHVQATAVAPGLHLAANVNNDQNLAVFQVFPQPESLIACFYA